MTQGTQAQPVVAPQTPTSVDPFDFDFGKGATTRSPNGTISGDANSPIATPPSAPAPGPDEDELTAEEKELAGFSDEPEAPKAEWSDDFKKIFKDTTGYDGPDDFKAKNSKITEEHRLLSEENKSLKTIANGVNKVHPHMRRALELEQQSPGAGQKYLRDLPAIDMLNKDASKLSDREALDAYIPDNGISQAEWDLLKDPDADLGVVDGLKRRIQFLRLNANDMHKQAQNSLQEEQAAGKQAQEALHKRYTEGIAATIANARNSSLKTYLNQGHLEEVQQGTFVNRFFEDDGVTPKPDLLETILKAEQFDKMREATKKAWYKKGKADGLAEQTSGMPTSPRQVGRSVQAPANGTKNPYVAALDAIERS